jgi:hypothetical protein
MRHHAAVVAQSGLLDEMADEGTLAFMGGWMSNWRNLQAISHKLQIINH